MDFSEILDVKDFMGVTDLTLYECWEVDQVKFEFYNNN